MRFARRLLIVSLLAVPALPAADQVAEFYDSQVKRVEQDIVRLAEAMPPDKFDFAPTTGNFKGVRTFGQQAKHLATTIYNLSAALRGEKPPVDVGTTEDGPTSLRTKAQIVDYLQGSVTYAHKAMATMTAKNQFDNVSTSSGNKMSRAAAASMISWHSYDHYGQMVIYARMNGIVPPASQ